MSIVFCIAAAFAFVTLLLSKAAAVTSILSLFFQGNYRAGGIGYQVVLFTIGKALYLIGQPAYLRKAGHITRNLMTAKPLRPSSILLNAL